MNCMYNCFVLRVNLVLLAMCVWAVDVVSIGLQRPSWSAFSDDVILHLYRTLDISNIYCWSLRLRYNEVRLYEHLDIAKFCNMHSITNIAYIFSDIVTSSRYFDTSAHQQATLLAATVANTWHLC